MPKHAPLYIRFWRYVEKTDGCWLWTGAKTEGYGRIRLSRSRLSDGVHRVSWQFAYGPIPDGMQVLHRCDVRNCVNPEHLFLGTNADNMADKKAKRRTADVSGRRNPKAKLTEEQVADIRARWKPGPIGRPKDGAESLTAQLAREYGVTKSEIYHIGRGWTWRHKSE